MPAASIVKSKKQETYKVTFNNLTQGELIALKNALGLWAERSQVATDVECYLDKALEVEGSPVCRDISKTKTPSFDKDPREGLPVIDPEDDYLGRGS